MFLRQPQAKTHLSSSTPPSFSLQTTLSCLPQKILQSVRRAVFTLQISKTTDEFVLRYMRPRHPHWNRHRHVTCSDPFLSLDHQKRRTTQSTHVAHNRALFDKRNHVKKSSSRFAFCIRLSGSNTTNRQTCHPRETQAMDPQPMFQDTHTKAAFRQKSTAYIANRHDLTGHNTKQVFPSGNTRPPHAPHTELGRILGSWLWATSVSTGVRPPDQIQRGGGM